MSAPPARSFGQRTVHLDCDVLTADGGPDEVQATAERTPPSRAHFDELLALAEGAIADLRAAQEAAIAGAG